MDRDERIRVDKLAQEPIEFYGPSNPYGFMSNFSRHPVLMPHPFSGRMARYETTEHRFQAMKATSAKEHDLVLATAFPREAKKAGGKVELREGWGSRYGDLCWYVMCETLLAKASQHPDLLSELLATGDTPLWESAPSDAIWGIRKGNDYSGKNLLGRAWMYTRLIHSRP